MSDTSANATQDNPLTLTLGPIKDIEKYIVDPPIPIDSDAIDTDIKEYTIALVNQGRYATVPSLLEAVRHVQVDVPVTWHQQGTSELLYLAHERCIFTGTYVLYSPEEDTVPHIVRPDVNSQCRHMSVKNKDDLMCTFALWDLDAAITLPGHKVIPLSKTKAMVASSQTIYHVNRPISIRPPAEWLAGIFMAITPPQ